MLVLAQLVSQLCLCVLGQLRDTLNKPRSAFVFQPKVDLGLQQNSTLSGMWGPRREGAPLKVAASGVWVPIQGGRTMLRFGYLGKWSPYGCGSLTIRGKYLTHCAIYFMCSFTLTFSSVKRVKFFT
jgi:hypothetical protein